MPHKNDIPELVRVYPQLIPKDKVQVCPITYELSPEMKELLRYYEAVQSIEPKYTDLPE